MAVMRMYDLSTSHLCVVNYEMFVGMLTDEW